MTCVTQQLFPLFGLSYFAGSLHVKAFILSGFVVLKFGFNKPSGPCAALLSG